MVFNIYSSNMYNFHASHNLHSSQECLIPVLVTVLAISTVCYSSTHNIYIYIYAYSVSSCMHCSVMVVDTECPLQGMLAVDTLPLVNVCTHLEAVWYGRAWWLSASCSSSWITAMENWYFDVQMLLLHGLTCLNEAVSTVIFMHEIRVYFCTCTLIRL